MLEPTYKINRISPRRLEGVTAPSPGTIHAIIKNDCFECPHAVYNEIVALRLAQTIHAPVSNGSLTVTDTGTAYASLQLSSPGMALPNLLNWQRERASDRYAMQVASLVAFDILIGNTDRSRNLKASILPPHPPLFAGFDHANAVLGCRVEVDESLSWLASERLIVRFHPFYGLADYHQVEEVAFRYMELAQEHPGLIRDCACFGMPIRDVSEELQATLADALVTRCLLMPQIIETNATSITIRG